MLDSYKAGTRIIQSFIQVMFTDLYVSNTAKSASSFIFFILEKWCWGVFWSVRDFFVCFFFQSTVWLAHRWILWLRWVFTDYKLRCGRSEEVLVSVYKMSDRKPIHTQASIPIHSAVFQTNFLSSVTHLCSHSGLNHYSLLHSTYFSTLFLQIINMKNHLRLL